jgi:hypothetical protein
VTEGNRNKQWALRSIRTEAHVGPKGPNAFASALAGGFDEGERAVYVSVMLRYPYGPYMTATTARLGATNFPAAGDAERLRRLADNYQLRQYPTEPDESFEERLGLAWELHEEGGTAIITGYECEYQWAWEVVFGPNYGTVPIDGCYLGTAILGDEATGYLGLGSFSSEQLDDLVRIALDHRQAQDMPIRFIFRFGAAALLGLAELGVAVLGGGANNVAIREIQGRRMVGSCYLGTTTLKGFGVTHNG